MTIKNGELADADEVMNALGSLFNDTAQNIFNADYIGFDSQLNDSGVPNLTNVEYDTGLTTTYYSEGVEQYDFTSGTLADTWTMTNDYTEGADYLMVYVDSEMKEGKGISNNSPSPITLGNDESFLIDHVGTTGPDHDTGIGISIWDGSTRVHIRTTSGPTNWARVIWRLNIDKTSKTCYFGADIDSLVQTGVNLSALNNASTWYFQFWAGSGSTGTTDDANVKVYDIKKLSDSVANEFIIDVGTVSGTVTNLIPILNTSSDGTVDADFEISVDNGSNYEAVTSGEILRPINTGTQIKLKALLTSDATLNLTHLNEYAIKYNLY